MFAEVVEKEGNDETEEFQFTTVLDGNILFNFM